MRYKTEVQKFNELVDTGHHFFVFDIETTGFNPSAADIIQFSACEYKRDGSGYKLVATLNTYINPGYPIPAEITELTGITNEMVKDAPCSKDAAHFINLFLGEDPVLMGYNSVTFDTKFMQFLYRKHLGVEFKSKFHLDVLKMAKEKMPSPHKLIDMAEKAGVADKFSFHSSLDDVKATFEVFKFLKHKYEEPDVEKKAVVVTRLTRWRKSETLDRLYVSNNLNASIYFDVCSGEWQCPESIDEEAIIKHVCNVYSVNNSEELKKVLQENI